MSVGKSSRKNFIKDFFLGHPLPLVRLKDCLAWYVNDQNLCKKRELIATDATKLAWFLRFCYINVQLYINHNIPSVLFLCLWCFYTFCLIFNKNSLKNWRNSNQIILPIFIDRQLFFNICANCCYQPFFCANYSHFENLNLKNIFSIMIHNVEKTICSKHRVGQLIRAAKICYEDKPGKNSFRKQNSPQNIKK